MHSLHLDCILLKTAAICCGQAAERRGEEVWRALDGRERELAIRRETREMEAEMAAAEAAFFEAADVAMVQKRLHPKGGEVVDDGGRLRLQGRGAAESPFLLPYPTPEPEPEP